MDAETFREFFRRQIEVVDALGCLPNEMVGITDRENVTLYKKIAYVSFLDCFASLRFSKDAFGKPSRNNRKRFIDFLQQDAAWEVGSMISLSFLNEKLLNVKTDGKLVRYINEKLCLGYDFGDTISAAKIDESIEPLLKLASTEAEKKAIRDCQHYSIMYRYRNNLVHQARRPGRASENLGKDNDEACYHTYAGKSVLYLLYPIALFKRLCVTSLNKLGRYFEENKLDPLALEDDPRCF